MGNAAAEKSLLAAVLVRAVRDLVVYSRSASSEEERMAEAARKWIFEGPVDDDHIASFRNICLVMDLDHERVRKRILTMRPDEAKRGFFGMWSYLH